MESSTPRQSGKAISGSRHPIFAHQKEARRAWDQIPKSKAIEGEKMHQGQDAMGGFGQKASHKTKREGAGRAFVTGVSGQAGSYLSEHLLSLGYRVRGLVRYTSDLTASRKNIDRLADNPNFDLVYGDVLDQSSLVRTLGDFYPDEIYNLAAQSHVRHSFNMPTLTAESTGLGVLRLLEAAREICSDSVRIFQASSSELFGDAPAPQNESTPFRPRSPYAAAKLFAHSIAVNYREAYGMHVSCGIMFNYESPRRSPAFVTRKITRGVARIACGLEKRLTLGNLEARRDWGHAKDAVRAMHLMLQQPTPDDYVIATGRSETVREFLRLAFCASGAPQENIEVAHDPQYFRPTEVSHLCGDSAKARSVLGWQPEYTLEMLVAEMVRCDMFQAEYEAMERRVICGDPTKQPPAGVIQANG